MTTPLKTLFAISSAALALSACTPEDKALNAPPGEYDRTTVSTDENGTTVKREDSTDVTVDKYGKKKAVIHSKTTKDPKGLFNKTTTDESKEVIEEK